MRRTGDDLCVFLTLSQVTKLVLCPSVAISPDFDRGLLSLHWRSQRVGVSASDLLVGFTFVTGIAFELLNIPLKVFLAKFCIVALELKPI